MKRVAVGLFDWLLGRRKSSTEAPAASSTVRLPRSPAFAVIDVETTGLSPQRDRILELAIVRLDESGAVVDEWVSRFDPEGPVGATHIHGITQADVVGQPRFADVAPTVMAALSGLAVVAHNAKFDLAFLRNELNAAGWSVPRIAAYCTLDASYAYLPDMDRRRLVDCCWAVGGASRRRAFCAWGCTGRGGSARCVRDGEWGSGPGSAGSVGRCAECGLAGVAGTAAVDGGATRRR